MFYPMYRTNVPHRLQRLVGRSVLAIAGSALVPMAPAFADQLDQHNQLVSQLVDDMHADPLLADCAAHGFFVAGTSGSIDHVEFTPSSFDKAHSAVTPWNDSFGDRKQHVVVDTIVTVEGLGIREDGATPLELKFRCGYEGGRLLAFSWNDRVAPAGTHHRATFSRRRMLAAM